MRQMSVVRETRNVIICRLLVAVGCWSVQRIRNTFLYYTYGRAYTKRAFSYAAHTIWNNSPQTIRQMDLASVSLIIV